jgi:hypothetical protein
MRTHGEKRVRVILEAYFIANRLLSGTQQHDKFAVRIMPAFAVDVQRWVIERLMIEEVPSREDVLESFVKPVVAQLLTDSGPTIARLVEGRLGLTAEPQSVRQQARRMGVTRARVYQLLDECGKVMDVRWPEGRYLLEALQTHLRKHAKKEDDFDLFKLVIDTFFPNHEEEEFEEVGALAQRNKQ